nr:hypothetical protein [Tanacetum cinerariifolium]
MRRIGKVFSEVDTPLFDVTPPPSPTQEHIPSPPRAQTTQPSSPPPQQPSHTDISQSAMTLLNKLLEICANLTKQVANLEQDKIAQSIEITKLKTSQRIESLADIVMDDQEDASKQGGIVELDVDQDVTLVDAEQDVNADDQGRLAESQAKVVTTAATTITTAQVPKASAPRRMRVQSFWQWLYFSSGNGNFLHWQWEYTSLALTQKVSANMRRIRKGFSGVDTPLFDGMLVSQQAQDVEDATEDEDDVNEKIVELDADENLTLKEVDAEVTMDADVQGRLEESQAKVYHLDIEHAKKVLTMQDTDEAEPAEVEEVIKIVTAAKLMTKVVTTAATTITAAQVPKASASRIRRGVIIQDPKEVATTSIIMQSENDVVDQVKRKESQDNTVIRYQDLKRKPVTEAYARKNMMVYLKNMAGFKMDFFRGMTYTDIRPIFEKHYNLNQAFLERVEEEVTGQEEEGSKRKDDSPEQRAAKKQKTDEEIEELKTHLHIVPNDDDDDVYTESTHLALKVRVVDYQIHHEHNKPYYKIIKADGTHQLFLSFITLLKNFDREDLEMLWKLVQERFQSSEPNSFSDDFLLNTLKYKVSDVQIVSAASIVVNTVSSKEDLEMMWKLVQERFQSSEPKNFSDDFLLNTLKTSRKYAKGLLLLVKDLMLLVQVKAVR